jgi:hypothetical protein
MFRQFLVAIAARDYAGREAKDSLACVELISAAYASAADASRERTLDLLAG